MGVGNIYTVLLSLYFTHIATSDGVCLDYLACYNELFLDNTVVEIFHEDLEVRSADTCGSLCHDRVPQASVILAKIIDLNERLVCGCGSEAALGNRSGSVDNNFLCRTCPDGDQKCGGRITVSAYRKVTDDENCEDPSYRIPSYTKLVKDNVNQITTETIITAKALTTGTTIITPIYTTTRTTTYMPITDETLSHLGCYDESNINNDLLQKKYLDASESSKGKCFRNCKNTSERNGIYVLKVLNDTHLFCGCGSRKALDKKEDDAIDRCSTSQTTQCRFGCPADTYSAFYHNSATIVTLLPSLLSFVLMAHFLK